MLWNCEFLLPPNIFRILGNSEQKCILQNTEQILIQEDSPDKGMEFIFRKGHIKLSHTGRQSRKLIMASRKTRIFTRYQTNSYSLRDQQHWRKHARWYSKWSAMFCFYNQKKEQPYKRIHHWISTPWLQRNPHEE